MVKGWKRKKTLLVSILSYALYPFVDRGNGSRGMRDRISRQEEGLPWQEQRVYRPETRRPTRHVEMVGGVYWERRGTTHVAS